MKRAFVITLVGAESTGKSLLAQALHLALSGEGHRCLRIDEVLREFCTQAGRTPRQDEQAGIATEQTRRIAAAAEAVGPGGVVVADTSALMIAVYSDLVFNDPALYAEAQAAHGRADLTLLTALDLPWVADGHQRDGPHVREPVDQKLRAALLRAGLPFAVVAGQGPARLQAAQAAVAAAWRPRQSGTPSRWRHVCGRCGDADCERHLFGHTKSAPWMHG